MLKFTKSGKFNALFDTPIAQNRHRACDLHPVTCYLPLVRIASAFRIVDFAIQCLACQSLLSTLRLKPHDFSRMTRGRDVSPLLSRIGLSPTTTCQFVLAHSSPFSLPDWKLSDSEVAAVATYIRNAQGNMAQTVIVLDVKKLRAVLDQAPLANAATEP